MAGTFEIFRDSKGEYRFRLKGRNGEIVATGESYPTKAHVKRGSRPCSALLLMPRSRTRAVIELGLGAGNPCLGLSTSPWRGAGTTQA